MSSDRPADPGPFVVNPNAVYRPSHIASGLQIPVSGVLRYVRNGKLRASRRRGRTLILGQWLIDWLQSGELRRKGSGQGTGR
jgi:hypothetical protein